MSGKNNHPTYIVTDVETTGPSLFRHSMKNIGAVAVSHEGKLLDTFSANLKLRPGTYWDPDTYSWFLREARTAYYAIHEDEQDPASVMANFNQWLLAQPGVPMFVSAPLTYDWKWVDAYFDYYEVDNPFARKGVDLRSVIMGLRGVHYTQTSQKGWPKRWKSDLPHTHIGIDDAMKEAEEFATILKEVLAQNA